jgi:hypothetical protein
MRGERVQQENAGFVAWSRKSLQNLEGKIKIFRNINKVKTTAWATSGYCALSTASMGRKQPSRNGSVVFSVRCNCCSNYD